MILSLSHPPSSSPFVSRLPSETCSIIAHTCLSTSAKLPAFHYCRLVSRTAVFNIDSFMWRRWLST
jgi:hypothetical protein